MGRVECARRGRWLWAIWLPGSALGMVELSKSCLRGGGALHLNFVGAVSDREFAMQNHNPLSCRALSASETPPTFEFRCKAIQYVYACIYPNARPFSRGRLVKGTLAVGARRCW